MTKKKLNKEILDRVESRAYELVEEYHGCAQVVAQTARRAAAMLENPTLGITEEV
jgi:hypothetical protein